MSFLVNANNRDTKRLGDVLTVDASGVLSFSDNNLNMSGNTIENVSDPVNAQDAATRNYVDTGSSSSKWNNNGTTATLKTIADIDMQDSNITNIVSAQFNGVADDGLQPALLRLTQGQNELDFNVSPQISFGYNGGTRFQHFITTTHNSTKPNNAIHIFTCDGMSNNTLNDGVDRVFSFTHEENRSYVPLDMENTNKIINCADPENAQDVATKNYVDNPPVDLFKSGGQPTSRADASYITPSITPDNRWSGGVLAPNGKIYCVPYSSENVLIIDPITDTIDETSITGLTGTLKWIGGVLAPNGKIYCIPLNSNNVLVIDPEINNTTKISITGSTILNNRWSGGVLAPNGKIYGIPYSSENVLIIDPITDTVDETSITGLIGSRKWYGGVLAPNGKIYGIPYDRFNVLVIDPETNNTTAISITGTTGGGYWAGGAIAPNGKIYGIPYSSDNVLIIDPEAGTADATIITGLPSFNTWLGGVLARDGNIYCIPNTDEDVLVINTETDTTSTISITGTISISGSTWLGGVLTPNNKIYGIPSNNDTILTIIPDFPKYPKWPLEAYYNKL